MRHFLRFHPRGATTAQCLDYYQGYAKALAEASTQHLTQPVDWRCHEELRDCIARCVLAYQEKLQAEAAGGQLAS
ncbi:hypothetical protein JOF56_001197 [Kibdelosporangium banguiense]|uniref:Uncharacterized protein n=1 Tax=Kibdelosporangium banguiense TaxID=1365924 RepID=A0ABS4T8S8_9PSEU|nr:hypothetical protein [Kibdelosporangium banguiense]MBP2320812.1 hypothetical protein [Kibdelosporangium banguiense]